MTAAEKALDLIRNGMTIGLGSGRAAKRFIHVLGGVVGEGLRVRGVATSKATATLAASLGIPLVTLDEVGELDLTVDGADEVDDKLDLIKGYGGALVREKIVAASSKRLIILVGPEKLVPILGWRGILPVEIIPFGQVLCQRRLAQLGCRPVLRVENGQPFVSDNGNYILDCGVSPIDNPFDLERAILDIPGVVETGLFLGMAETVLIDNGSSVDVRPRS